MIIGKPNELDTLFGFGDIYGPNDCEERLTFLEELLKVIRTWDVARCIVEDFNVIRNIEERSGCERVDSSMPYFNNFIEEAGLMDLLIIGSNFTWCGSHDNATFSRLDYFLIVMEMVKCWPNLVLSALISDHFLVILCWQEVR